MSNPAFSTFLPILVIVIAMIVWWRAAVVIVGALVIALLVTGVQEVTSGIEAEAVRDTLVGPAPEPAVPGAPVSDEQAQH